MTVSVTIEDVYTAAARIAGAVVTTELRAVRIGDNALWLKCESAQTGGAFKLRGASNRLLAMSAAEQARGVVAFSSGNHAQGVAIAAQRLGMRATIVMPADAPRIKIEGTRAAGAEVVFFDRATEDRVAIATALAAQTGATVVPAFDDPHVIAGQGTVGLEIIEQLGRSPARIVVPCAGGGLASGVALACPGAEIVLVEPEGWDDMAHSLAAGEIIPVGANPPPTLCDALQALRVSPLTLDILHRRAASTLIVTDHEVEEAVRWAWREQALRVEPGGAAGLAAVLAGKVDIEEETVVVLSGGNIDPAVHARIIAAG